MRPIKFRAWDGERMMFKDFFDRNWYGTPKNDEGGCHCIRALMPNDKRRVDLMQFTGLHDKNGIEIYEGDVIRCSYPNGEFDIYTHIVTFENGAFRIPWAIVGNALRDSWEVEVIGNVHENLELVKP